MARKQSGWRAREVEHSDRNQSEISFLIDLLSYADCCRCFTEMLSRVKSHTFKMLIMSHVASPGSISSYLLSAPDAPKILAFASRG